VKVEKESSPEVVKVAKTAERESLSEPETSPEPEPAPVSTQKFNPSWVDFVKHVSSRNEVMLAAFLRRVNVVLFKDGKLQLQATSFDIDAIKEEKTLLALKDCLYSYSRVEDWRVDFEETSEARQAPAATEISSLHKASKRRKKDITVEPGSIAAEEQKTEAALVEKIKIEAKGQEAVKNIEQAFSGSVVERITVLDK